MRCGTFEHAGTRPPSIDDSETTVDAFPTSPLALKVRLVGTPAQPVLENVRRLWTWPDRRRHPELADVWHEGARLDALLRHLISPASNCIDIGCHIGSVLSLMIRCAPDGTHRAIEASPAKAALLQRRYPGVDIRSVAVSDTPGTVTFYDVVGQSGFSGLRRPVHHDPDDPGAAGTVHSYDVACETLDRLFVTDTTDAVPVDLMKIDVEGAELPALRGGAQLLEKFRPDIVFECAEETGLEAFDYTRADLHDFLTDTGYDVWLVRDHVFGRGPMGRDEFVRAGTYPFPGFNYVARPAGTEATRIM